MYVNIFKRHYLLEETPEFKIYKNKSYTKLPLAVCMLVGSKSGLETTTSWLTVAFLITQRSPFKST
jgi:hypothetical protein